jgi:hypothetical protein
MMQAIRILGRIFNFLRGRPQFFVLSLTRGNETLECDVRCAVSKSLKEKCALLIVCNDLSTDEYKTLWRITDVYEHIILTTPEMLTSVLDKASYISEIL